MSAHPGRRRPPLPLAQRGSTQSGVTRSKRDDRTQGPRAWTGSPDNPSAASSIGAITVSSVQLACVVHEAALLIVRRPWVRAPHAPPNQDREASAMASSARESPGACGTRTGPTPACAAREATEAAVRSRRSPSPGYRRSWGRSPRTRRCSRPRPGRPPFGQAVSARQPRYRDRADQRAGTLRPWQARCQDSSLNTPPGSRSVTLEQRRCLRMTGTCGRAPVEVWVSSPNPLDKGP